jgi:Ca2+-binding RTX toxin-like protein
MVLRIVESSSVGAGLRIDLGTTDNLRVAANVLVGRTDGDYWTESAISAQGSGHVVNIFGTVFAPQVAIKIGDDGTETGNILTIHEGATVMSHATYGAGVWMYGISSQLVNDGTIVAQSEAVIISAFSGGTSTIINRGEIQSSVAEAVSGYSSSDGVIVLQNSGRISGVHSYENQAANCSDRITNSGVMKGDIYLHASNDLYDGRRGKIDGIVYGGDGNDVLRGGGGNEFLEGNGDNDRLFGGAGRDTLTGGQGKDILNGGGGADVFVFDYASHSTAVESGWDVITDFSQSQKDKIDLFDLGIAARELVADSYTFIATARFNKQAGELRYYQKDGDTFVQVDEDGNGRADFAIQFKGLIDFAESDFIF